MHPGDALRIQSRPLREIVSPGAAERRRERAAAADVEAARTALARAAAARDDAQRRADTARRGLGWLPFARSRVERAEAALLDREMEAIGAADRVDAALAEARLVQAPTRSETWDHLERDFGTLAQSGRLWDATRRPRRPPDDRDPHRSVYRERVPVAFSRRTLPEYGGSIEALWFQNANGPDLYLFPDLLVLRDADGATAAVDLREIEANAYPAPTVETGTPPPDATHDGWMLRTVYGGLSLRSGGGLNEAYLVSDLQKAKQFVYALEMHQQAVRRWYADRGL